MYTLSQIRNRLIALRRKYAKELAVVRLRPLAEEFSQEWAVAVASCREAPQSHPFIRRIARHGFRLFTFMSLHEYLEGCRSRNDFPDCYSIIAALLPQFPPDRLRQFLQWDSPARP